MPLVPVPAVTAEEINVGFAMEILVDVIFANGGSSSWSSSGTIGGYMFFVPPELFLRDFISTYFGVGQIEGSTISSDPSPTLTSM